MGVDWLRIGRYGQVAGIGLIAVFFVTTALAAPPLHESARNETVGNLTVSAMGAGWDGSVTHYGPAGEQRWQHTGADSYNGIQRVDDEQWLVTWTTHESDDCGEFEPKCARTGVRIVDPETGNVSWEWSQAVRNGRNSEIHDAEVLPDGDVLVADMDRERVVIVNRSDQSIDWEWQASEHYAAPDDPTTVDWLHINDVDQIRDGRFLVSVRNANQLLVIERGAGVVEVVNADGGGDDRSCLREKQMATAGVDEVQCGDESVLNHQHNPQWLGDGEVLVADSENDRVVELHREDGEWTVAWALSSANGVPFDWPRDADRLANGNTLVTDTRNARVVEVARNGTVLYSQSVPEQAYDADVKSEYPAGPAYENASGQTIGVSNGQPLAAVERMYGAVRWALPLPYWVTSWHVLVSLVGAMLIIYGTLARQLVSGENSASGSETAPEVSADD